MLSASLNKTFLSLSVTEKAGTEELGTVGKQSEDTADKENSQALESQLKTIHIDVRDSSTTDNSSERDTQDTDGNKLYREGDVLPGSCIEEGEQSDDDDEDGDNDDDDDDDDDDGWITPGNIQELKKSMGMPEAQKADVSVGCLTTDFAMQVRCQIIIFEIILGLVLCVCVCCHIQFNIIIVFIHSVLRRNW